MKKMENLKNVILMNLVYKKIYTAIQKTLLCKRMKISVILIFVRLLRIPLMEKLLNIK